MPEEFRGGKQPMTAVSQPPAEPPKVKPLPVALPSVVKIKAKKKKIISPILLVAGGFFFLLIVGVMVFLYFSLNQKEAVEETEVAEEVKESEGESEKSETVEEEETTEPVPGTDQDSDGLTDVEEILFGASQRLPDTDNDTYLDGNEVYHLYSPRTDLNATLLEVGLVREYASSELGLTVLYPSRWTAQEPLDDSTVLLAVPSGEHVRIERTVKESGLTIRQWYNQEVKGDSSPAEEPEEITTKRGHLGLRSQDKLTTYLETDEFVFIIQYDLNGVKTINFLTTYQMIVNGLTLL